MVDGDESPRSAPGSVMIIPHTALSSEVLMAIAEEFVTREGTDYGMVAYSLESKVASVVKQVQTGKAVVVFDPKTESCDIVMKGTARYRSVVEAGLIEVAESE